MQFAINKIILLSEVVNFWDILVFGLDDVCSQRDDINLSIKLFIITFSLDKKK